MEQPTAIPTTITFQNHPIRTIQRDNQTWFVTADICQALGITDSMEALDHIPQCERNVIKNQNLGGCGTCPNVDYEALHNGHITNHIMGGKDSILGTYPLLPDGSCHFIAGDFDRHNPTDPDPWGDVQKYIATCEINEFPCYVLRSKSGNGYHVYSFFQDAVPAWKARIVSFALLKEAGVIGDDVELFTFDRLFPNQDKLSGKGLGNLIAAPFQGGAGLHGHTLILDPETNYKEPFPDQWTVLRDIEKATGADLDRLIDDWKLEKEAPPKRANSDFKPIQENQPLGIFSRIKAGCPFIKHCCNDSDKASEPEWYAFLTIVARCEDGRRLAHKYSADHISYGPDATDQKIEHALTDTGPYLCETIRGQINGKYCQKCTHLGKISTPLRLGEQAGLDEVYTGIIREMNKQHAVIMVGGKCHILNEIIDPTFNKPDISLSTPTDFRNFYANQKIIDPNKPEKELSKAQYWFEHAQRRQFNGIVFDPSGIAGPDYYNLWQGLAVKPQSGDWSLYRQLVFDVIAGGKQSIYEWVLAWLARVVQDPGGKRPGTAIVLRGKQGTGKGVFVNTFGEILGRHCLQIAQESQITGRFNSHLKDTVLAFVDEGFWAGGKQAEGAIRNMITEPFITVEQKGKDLIRVKNNVNLIFASNSGWVVPAGLEERRFFVLDVSDKHQQGKAFFKALVNQMENGGVEAMLYDLLKLDISGVDLRTFEQTAGLFEQKIYSMTTVQKYWFERLMDGNMRPPTNGEDLPKYGSYSAIDDGDWDGEIQTDRQHQDYLDFAERIKDRFPLAETQISMDSMDSMTKPIMTRVLAVHTDLQKSGQGGQAWEISVSDTGRRWSWTNNERPGKGCDLCRGNIERLPYGRGFAPQF